MERLNRLKEKNGRTVSRLKLDLESLQKTVSSKKGKMVRNFVAEIKDKLRSVSQADKKVDSVMASSLTTFQQSDSLSRTKEDGKEEGQLNEEKSFKLHEFGSVSLFLNIND